jgi:hypothetical protein
MQPYCICDCFDISLHFKIKQSKDEAILFAA